MALELHDAYGRLTVEHITEADVAALDEPAQRALARLIPLIEKRQKAQERFGSAVKAKHACEAEQVAAYEAHELANPAMSALEAHRQSIAAFNKSN